MTAPIERLTRFVDAASARHGETLGAICTDGGVVSLTVSDLRAVLAMVPADDPTAPVPDPVAGQVWRSPKPTVAPRTVTRVNHCSGVHYERDDGRSGVCYPMAWRAWARSNNARPVTP
jgi:hypothetical protein